MKHTHAHHHTPHFEQNAKRTLWIIFITLLTMGAEIAYGFFTNSMALLSDGWHMGTHALALGITYAAYVYIRRIQKHSCAYEVAQRISSLAGYTSALFLLITAVWLFAESFLRFLNPCHIAFDEAILVAAIGLIVNVVCILVMEFKNEGAHSDNNYKAACLHILTDILTSVLAIIALISGKFWGCAWLDPMMGILGSLLIFKWSLALIKDSAQVLLSCDESCQGK